MSWIYIYIINTCDYSGANATSRRETGKIFSGANQGYPPPPGGGGGALTRNRHRRTRSAFCSRWHCRLLQFEPVIGSPFIENSAENAEFLPRIFHSSVGGTFAKLSSISHFYERGGGIRRRGSAVFLFKFLRKFANSLPPPRFGITLQCFRGNPFSRLGRGRWGAAERKKRSKGLLIVMAFFGTGLNVRRRGWRFCSWKGVNFLGVIDPPPLSAGVTGDASIFCRIPRGNWFLWLLTDLWRIPEDPREVRHWPLPLPEP